MNKDKQITSAILQVVNEFLNHYKQKSDGYGVAIEGTVRAGSRSRLNWYASCQGLMTMNQINEIGGDLYDEIANCIPKDNKNYKNFNVTLSPITDRDGAYDQEISFSRTYNSYYITNPNKI